MTDDEKDVIREGAAEGIETAIRYAFPDHVLREIVSDAIRTAVHDAFMDAFQDDWRTSHKTMFQHIADAVGAAMRDAAEAEVDEC